MSPITLLLEDIEEEEETEEGRAARMIAVSSPDPYILNSPPQCPSRSTALCPIPNRRLVN